MDIELKLRELLVPRDPGATFTESVLSRVGDVPSASAADGVVRLADARTRWRSRRLLLGVVVVVAAAAAAMLPLLPDRGGKTRESVVAATPAGGLQTVDATVPAGEPDVAGDEAAHAAAEDCIDPDILYGLLLPGPAGQGFRITSTVPGELASFKPPRELDLLGTTERNAGAGLVSSTVYRTSLDAQRAQAATAAALAAAGWMQQAEDTLRARNVFVSGAPASPAQTWCRDGMPVTLAANALDGVTYVALSTNRPGDVIGVVNACGQSRPMGPLPSMLDEHLPTLLLPTDPATGRPVALRGGGGGSGGGERARAHASFSLNHSAEAVASHFASQMAAQGWSSDTSWGGTGTAGSTWTRQMDAGTLLQATLAVTAFGEDRVTVVFSVVTTD